MLGGYAAAAQVTSVATAQHSPTKIIVLATVYSVNIGKPRGIHCREQGTPLQCRFLASQLLNVCYERDLLGQLCTNDWKSDILPIGLQGISCSVQGIVPCCARDDLCVVIYRAAPRIDLLHARARV